MILTQSTLNSQGQSIIVATQKNKRTTVVVDVKDGESGPDAFQHTVAAHAWVTEHVGEHASVRRMGPSRKVNGYVFRPEQD